VGERKIGEGLRVKEREGREKEGTVGWERGEEERRREEQGVRVCVGREEKKEKKMKEEKREDRWQFLCGWEKIMLSSLS
jgi:hypothetical protein